jgi:hypothetical protein
VAGRKILDYLDLRAVLRCSRSTQKKGSFVAWLWRVEFGAVALCLSAVILRLMVREAGALARAAKAEDWLLLAGALVTAGRVAVLPWAGDLATGWVWMFAATCAVHLAAKGFRATRVEN